MNSLCLKFTSLIQNKFNRNKLSFYETWFGLLHNVLKIIIKSLILVKVEGRSILNDIETNRRVQ